MLYYILFNSSLTPAEAVIDFLITIFVFMFSLSLHEFSHAFAAYKMGDPTAKAMGRMTLNPFKHLDFSGFMLFIFLGVGWAKPVPINPLNFKKYKKGSRIVSASGIVSNFILGLVSALLYLLLKSTVGYGNEALNYIYLILEYTMLINSFLVMFNILPFAPLDGYNFVASFAKSNNKFLTYMARNGVKILIGILLFGLITDIFFGFDVFTVYLSLLNNYVFLPIAF